MEVSLQVTHKGDTHRGEGDVKTEQRHAARSQGGLKASETRRGKEQNLLQ